MRATEAGNAARCGILATVEGRLGAVYLARHAEGIDALRRFARSYLRHPAGVTHDLVVIYKGFTQQAALNEARAVFPFPHIGLELPDTGFDVGSYIEASRRLGHEYLAYFNTHSEIASDGWLAKLYAAASKPGVGVAGATGSFESLHDSSKLLYKFEWLYYHRAIRCPDVIRRHFDFQIRNLRRQPPERRSWLDYPAAYALFAAQWVRVRLPGRQLAWLRSFPRFPNPHVRSNAFIVRRERMAFEIPRSKHDALLFESSAESLTASVRRRGLAALVVGRDGTYDVDRWPTSRTFRLGRQDNLLVADNQTRGFAAMTPEVATTHARISWGDYIPLPSSPTFGLRFSQAARLIRPPLAA